MQDVVSAKTDPSAQWREGTLLTSSCCSWDVSPAQTRAAAEHPSVMKALQMLRPCPLHPYLALVGSSPQTLSFHGHAGGTMPEPPLATGSTGRGRGRGNRTGSGCSDRHHVNTGSREKCHGSQPGLQLPLQNCTGLP